MGKGGWLMEASGQFGLDLRPGEITAGQVLDRIRRESRDEAEKGRWFENLVSRVLRDQKEYEVAEVHRWADWPEREVLKPLSRPRSGFRQRSATAPPCGGWRARVLAKLELCCTRAGGCFRPTGRHQTPLSGRQNWLLSMPFRFEPRYLRRSLKLATDRPSFRNANRRHRRQFADQRVTRPARRPINSVEQAWSAECPFRTFGKQPE